MIRTSGCRAATGPARVSARRAPPRRPGRPALGGRPAAGRTDRRRYASTPLARAQATARSSRSVATTRARVRVRGEQDPGDGTGPRAQVDRRAGRRQQLHGAAGQLLGLPAGHVDAGIDAELEVAEGDAAGDPGQRFAREAAPARARRGARRRRRPGPGARPPPPRGRRSPAVERVETSARRRSTALRRGAPAGSGRGGPGRRSRHPARTGRVPRRR